jgi:leader peptidase (prepilin peptidase)/N-methyltransferase
MPTLATTEYPFGIFAFVLGAIVGSFLNACIHRMPRGLSLNKPRRSFCPGCERGIPWHENLPLVSWLALRGKCSRCGWRIPFRYFLVEALTALLFVAVWERFGLPLGPAYFVFVSLLIVATFIDFEHFIIPDEITWGGTVAGVLISVAIPEIMNAATRWEALAFSLGGAILGFGLLFLVVEGGKLAFGKIRHSFPEAADFEWKREGDRIVLTLAGEDRDWMEIFSRERDVLTIEIDGVAMGSDGTEFRGSLKFWHNRLESAGAGFALDQLERISGKMNSVVIPREAMGFGDVKFIACIGAFLGWQAVLFTIFSASIIGSVAGIAGIALARDRAGVRIPFGPFLALGALLWLFGGRELAEWYFGSLRGGL